MTTVGTAAKPRPSAALWSLTHRAGMCGTVALESDCELVGIETDGRCDIDGDRVLRHRPIFDKVRTQQREVVGVERFGPEGRCDFRRDEWRQAVAGRCRVAFPVVELRARLRFGAAMPRLRVVPELRAVAGFFSGRSMNTRHEMVTSLPALRATWCRRTAAT